MATITNQEYQNVQNYVNSNYTADSLKSYSNAYKNYMSQGMSSKDAASKASSLLVKSNTSTASTPTSTQTTATQSSANRNTTSTATSTNNNRNTGTYVDSDGYTSATQRNMATSGAEFGRSNTTQNQTSIPATSNLSNTKNMWDNLSYDQQQEKLNQIPGLKESLTKKGWTIKSPTAQGTQQTPAKSQTNPGQWDYQDNSDARMMEIANNLNNYRVSNPELFNDWNTFSKFFIDGKGRSQDQINYLKDYFDAVKQYNGYDNMSAPSVGEMVARGEIPEGYLNYIKYANPDRYAEIMDYKDQAEKGIMNETYYANLVNNSDLADPEWMKWAKENQFIIDENNDNLDDRLYHAPTEEEQTLVNEYSTLASEQLADQNTYRDLMSDLREQYPDADESTLMILAGDRGKKIQDRMDTRNVTMTKLNGQITYLQNERTTQNNAGQQTINQLQKAYGMYYDYSPEGMSELAQAQYAATNVTLDQADNGNETQKQMALESVLDGYYDKYGDIIQRSEQQVINDVIAYAKKNGIGLAQALQENFVKPLQEKPEFATLSSGRTITNGGTDKWSVEKIKDANGNDLSVMINQATGEIRSIDGNTYTGGTSGTTSTGKSYNVVSPTELTDGLSNFVSGYELGDFGGRCGAFVNEGLKQMGVTDTNMYGNSKESKLGTKNEDANATAQTGWVAIWKPEVLTGDGAKYGHVGFVVQDNGDGTVKVLDSNGTKNPATGQYDKTVGVHDVPKSSLYGYFNPSQGAGTVGGVSGGDDNGDGDLFSAKVLSWIPTQLRNTDVEKQWYLDIAEKQRAKGLSSFETAMAIMGFDITNNSALAQNTKQKILDATMAQGDEIVFNSAVLSSMAQSINKGDYEKALLTLENQLGSFMSKSDGGDLSRSTVSQGMKAINDLEKIKTWKSYGAGGWNTVADLIGAEGKNTATFNVWTSNVSRALRGLGYEKEEIDEMLPKLTNDKTTFNNRVSAIEDALLGQYNTIRRNHNLPSMTKEALLGNQSLYDIYKVWNTEQLRNAVSNAQNRNINLRYGQPTTITAEAIKII